MAGSIRWFQYTGDNGLKYAIEIDETTGEAPPLGFEAIETGPTGPVAQGRIISASGSRPLRPRRANLSRVNVDGETIRRSVIVGSASSSLWTGATNTVFLGGNTFSVTSTRGEAGVRIPAVDTGLKDGDEDDNFAS